MVGSMMKKLIVLVLAALAAFSVWLCRKSAASRVSMFKAECAFILSNSPVGTNFSRGTGTSANEGSYQDSRIVVRDGLGLLLPGGRQYDALLKSFVRSDRNHGFSASAISNAFKSVGYNIESGATAVVRMHALAESEELALKVTGYILEKYSQLIAEEDLDRENKALAKLRWDIKRKTVAREDVSQLRDELDRAERSLRDHRREVIIISRPFVMTDSGR